MDREHLYQEIARTGLSSSSEINDLLDHLECEISNYHDIVLRVFEEFNAMARLYTRVDYDLAGKAKYPAAVYAGLALRQYELCSGSTHAFATSQYMICATLIRSVFEGNMVCLYLSHNPDASIDFMVFSEVSGNPDVDWERYGFSKTRIEKLKKKFGIRSMMRELYAGSDDADNRISTANFYQQLCNITHPNLEPSAVFYRPNKPPSAAYSSIGLRRTATQLFGVLNTCSEMISGGLLEDKFELEASYRRKAEVYRLHKEATAWHAANPNSEPTFTRNRDFKLAIASDSAWLLGYPEHEDQRRASVVTIPTHNATPSDFSD